LSAFGRKQTSGLASRDRRYGICPASLIIARLGAVGDSEQLRHLLHFASEQRGNVLDTHALPFEAVARCGERRAVFRFGAHAAATAVRVRRAPATGSSRRVALCVAKSKSAEPSDDYYLGVNKTASYMAHKIAVIAGDGVGNEVMPEGLRVLEAAARKFDIALELTTFPWANCDYYLEHGDMMPADWFEQLKGFDAIYFGAVGWPAKVPDHVSLWGSLIKFRRDFDQYVNLRPVRLMPGVPCPLANREPGDIDFYVVRENTEGEYSSVGGHMFPGTDREVVVQESVFSRKGVDRILKYAFDLAQRRGKKHLTSATKSNGISISMPYWDQRVVEMAKNYPDVRWDKYHIDILCARFVISPERFDVVVASNLFGDILSDLGPACTGTIGIAPSASINPARSLPSLFEPVHGSAPDIYGRNIANPVGMIWSGALMLDFLGDGRERYTAAHDAIVRAVEKVLAEGFCTPDLGGTKNTTEMGARIAAVL
jgi:tartrate dehydrogenase/decarboxylase / D-malate dehydrogenase